MTGDAYGNPTVVAFDRTGSSLYRSITTGFMPPGPGDLTDGVVEVKIRKSGAKSRVAPSDIVPHLRKLSDEADPTHAMRPSSD
jgi:hypothetical protein